jgi:tetratricopeptide (TPR) repeat protein
MGSLDDLPKRSDSHDVQTSAERAFEYAIEAAGLFVIQTKDRADYGTDFQLECRNGSAMTNFRTHVQLKGTDALPNNDGSISIALARTNLNYLLGQPDSLYICYHISAKTMLVRYAADVCREYEHKQPDWMNQEQVTVRFTQGFGEQFQRELHRRILASGREQRDDRFKWAVTPPDQLINEVQKAVPSIDVPHVRQLAKDMLTSLFDAFEEAIISKAFEKFAAVLDENEGEMDLAYMAEINLGINRSQGFDRQRVRKSIEILELGFARHKTHPGSIHYCIGNAWLVLEEFDAAIRSYSAAIELLGDPQISKVAAQCFKNKGAAHEGLQDFETAKQCFENALKLDPSLPEAHFALGLWHRAHDRDFHAALMHYEQAIPERVSPDLAIAPIAWKIEAYFFVGDAQSAFREVRTVQCFVKQAPWIISWCASLVARFGRGSLDSAQSSLKFWQWYLRHRPEDQFAQREHFMCHSYLHSRGVDSGINHQGFKGLAMNLVNAGDAEAALIWDRLGHWAQDEGNWKDAEVAYRKAFEIDPIQFGYCFGTSLNFLGKFQEALPILTVQAEHLNDALSWFQVAIAKEGMKDIGGCIAAYWKALELDSEYALAWFNLGGVYWNAKMVDEAFTVWSEALQRFPDQKQATELLEMFPFMSSSQNQL